MRCPAPDFTDAVSGGAEPGDLILCRLVAGRPGHAPTRPHQPVQGRRLHARVRPRRATSPKAHAQVAAWCGTACSGHGRCGRLRHKSQNAARAQRVATHSPAADAPSSERSPVSSVDDRNPHAGAAIHEACRRGQRAAWLYLHEPPAAHQRPNLNWNGDRPAATISRPTLSSASSVKYMFPSLPSVMRWNTVPVLGTW